MPRLTVALRLIRLREKAQWSQRELERRAQLSLGLVSRIERGLVLPSASTVLKIATALGVPVCVLYPSPHQEEEHAHAS